MARKRRPVDPELGTRLLGERLRRLAERPAGTSAALEVLIGGIPDLSAYVPPPRPDPEPAPAEASDAGAGVHPFTVYLTARDLADAVYIQSVLRRLERRKVSRSEVIRHALRGFRTSLDDTVDPAGAC